MSNSRRTFIKNTFGIASASLMSPTLLWKHTSALAALPQNVVRTGSSLPLVLQRKPNSIIATSNKPSSTVALAAKVLSDHLLEISGARVPIVKESALHTKVTDGRIVNDANNIFILVGESNLTNQLGIKTQELENGAIRVQASDNTLVLLGADHPADPETTLYAVSAFLEDKLGVRYLWPGESGKVVPKQDDIIITEFLYQYSPKIKQRQIRNSDAPSPRRTIGLEMLGATDADYAQLKTAADHTSASSPTWYTWQKLGGSMGLVTGHAFGYIWEKYGKEHPEWFAMQLNGSRDQSASPDRARLCVSNLQLQAAIARDKTEELDNHPGQTSVSIDPNDGGVTTFCVCPVCKKLDPPEGRPIRLWDFTGKERKIVDYVSLTDRMVYFWNGIAEQVVKKYPDALLTVRAYSVYSAPPLHRKLHPNIVVEQVSGDYFIEEKIQQDLEDWTAWGKFAKRLAWRPNIYSNQRRNGFPAVYVHRMASDVSARAKAGMISTDIDSMHKGWAINGINLYVLARLNWNPDLNVDAIINDYCITGFGKGAMAMKKYFQGIEKLTYEVKDDDRNTVSYTMASLYDASAIATLKGYLDEAQQATVGDMAIQKRIEFVRQGLSFAELQAQAFDLVQDIKDHGKTNKEKIAEDLMTKRYSLMKTIYQNHTLAIDIPMLLWGSEASFRSLQTSKTKSLLAKPAYAKTVIDADGSGVPEEQQAAVK